METQEVLNLGIGTEDHQALKPAKVKITAIHIKDKKNDGEAMKTPLAEIMCKHPDRDELVAFTKVKLERNGNLQIVGTWVQVVEEEGKKVIQKGSTLAHLVDFLGVKSLQEVYGKEIEAIQQSSENNYLCLKAY